MWLGIFDIVRDTDILKENFSKSPFSKALNKYGEWETYISGGSRTIMEFKKGEREIEFVFYYDFTERTMQIIIRDNKHEDIGETVFDYVESEDGYVEYKKFKKPYEPIHKDLFKAFKDWLKEINLDCLMVMIKGEGLFSKKETYGEDVLFTYSGEESKTLVNLMKNLPHKQLSGKEENIFFLKIYCPFDQANFLIKPNFYPKPCVDIIFGQQEFLYQKELLDLCTLKRCFNEEDIADFFSWVEEFVKEKDLMKKALYTNLLKEKGEAEKIEDDSKMLTLYKDKDEKKQEYGVFPIMANYKPKYIAYSPSHAREGRVVETKEDAIFQCINDKKTILQLEKVVKDINQALKKYDTVTETKNEVIKYRQKIKMYDQNIEWEISYKFKRGGTSPIFSACVKGEKDIADVLDLSEVKTYLIEKLVKRANALRVRSLFEEKEKI